MRRIRSNQRIQQVCATPQETLETQRTRGRGACADCRRRSGANPCATNNTQKAVPEVKTRQAGTERRSAEPRQANKERKASRQIRMGTACVLARDRRLRWRQRSRHTCSKRHRTRTESRRMFSAKGAPATTSASIGQASAQQSRGMEDAAAKDWASVRARYLVSAAQACATIRCAADRRSRPLTAAMTKCHLRLSSLVAARRLREQTTRHWAMGDGGK